MEPAAVADFIPSACVASASSSPRMCFVIDSHGPAVAIAPCSAIATTVSVETM